MHGQWTLRPIEAHMCAFPTLLRRADTLLTYTLHQLTHSHKHTRVSVKYTSNFTRISSILRSLALDAYIRSTSYSTHVVVCAYLHVFAPMIAASSRTNKLCLIFLSNSVESRRFSSTLCQRINHLSFLFRIRFLANEIFCNNRFGCAVKSFEPQSVLQ